MTVEEHALTLSGPIIQSQLEYLINKANRLGLSGRTVRSLHFEAKDFTQEIYFIVDEPKPKNYGGCYP